MAKFRVAFLTNKVRDEYDLGLISLLRKQAAEQGCDFYDFSEIKEVSEILRSSVNLILITTGQVGNKVLPNLAETYKEEG
mmetsp:Transcript_21351/g.33031  ORF Transcript_21351/g.33031 Transcript_21351/m.33031 type:complete len:80 (+) Transcript_21351:3276-3515(+)